MTEKFKILRLLVVEAQWFVREDQGWKIIPATCDSIEYRIPTGSGKPEVAMANPMRGKL